MMRSHSCGDDPDLGPALRDGRLLAYRVDAAARGRGAARRDGRANRDGRPEARGGRRGPRDRRRAPRPARGRALRRRRRRRDRARRRRSAGSRTPARRRRWSAVGAARVTVTRDGETLWSLIVVRPAASSGSDGLGRRAARRVLPRPARAAARARPDPERPLRRRRVRPVPRLAERGGPLQGAGRGVAPGFRLCPAPRHDGARDRRSTTGTSAASPSTSTATRWCWSASWRPAGTAT